MPPAMLLLVAGCVLPSAFAILSLLFKPNHRVFSVIFLASGLLLACGAVLSWNTVMDWQAPGWIAVGGNPVSLHCDTLSCFFLLLLGSVSFCCALFSPHYLVHLSGKISSRLYWSALLTFLVGMALVLLSANAVVFLVAWELMSLSSATLVVSEYRQHQAQRAAFIYVVATRIASIFLTAGFLIMYGKFSSISFSEWSFSEPLSWLPASLIALGLIIKSGIWPFHIWLPYAHPQAPSPVSALMSGVMVKVAVYAAMRFFVFGNLTCPWLIYAMFALSSVSAFWGVLFAINQREVKRLLAYSTVENVGLIFLSLALALWARNAGLATIAQMALLAALLHAFAHGLFKSLLFLCAGSVDRAAHSREFAMLGGLNKRMPITGLTFIIGSAAICALPPLNGFASKWCLYQALFHSAISMPVVVDRAICIAAIGILSGVGALSVACYAKATALVMLGKPRSEQANRAAEVPATMYVPQVLLAAACVAMGIGMQWLVDPLEPILRAAGQPPMSNIFAALPLWQLGGLLTLFVLAIYSFALRQRVIGCKTWDCGFGKTSVKSQVTADSFAQPIARIFSPVLHYHLSVDISGRDRRHFPEKIVVQPSMVSLLETKVYGPAVGIVQRLSRLVGKLQAGSIHLYLTYVCIALVVLVVLGTRL